METMTVLPKEIMGAVRWALRARQIPPAYAHPVGQLVLWGQLFHGVGLARLVSLLEQGAEAQVVELVEDGERQGLINGRSQPPLFCLSQLFDFAAARAAQQGSYRVQVSQLPAVLPAFFEALLVRLGEQGFAGWVKTADNHFYGVVPAAASGYLTREQAIFAQANGVTQPADHRFMLFCTQTAPALPTAAAVQLAEREAAWAGAQRAGIVVETAVWSALKAIASEILV